MANTILFLPDWNPPKMSIISCPFPSNTVGEDIQGASGENFSSLLLLPPTANCFFVRAGREADRTPEDSSRCTGPVKVRSDLWLDRQGGKTAHWVKHRTKLLAGRDWLGPYFSRSWNMQAVCLHSYSSRLERSHVMLGSLSTAVRPQDKTIYKADIIVCNIRENFYFVT